MKWLQAFFNDEATEYICDALSHLHVTETNDNNDIESADGSTASNGSTTSNHQLGRETNNSERTYPSGKKLFWYCFLREFT